MAAMRGFLAAVLLLAALGCNGETSILEQGARFPDDEGVVTDATVRRIELDGRSAYEISPAVESFGARSHQVTSLLAWEGKYVQIGLDGDRRVIWIAGIGTVPQSDDPVVRYSGIFQRVDDDTGRAVFEDGTTLELGRGIDTPPEGTEVAAEIDPETKRVTKLLW